MSISPVSSIRLRKRGTTDLAGAEVGAHRRARHSGHHDRAHERRELAQDHEHEQAAEAVERAEEVQEVRGLDPRRAVGEADRRDDHREPRHAQREQELRDELVAVRVGRPQRRGDRLPAEDAHRADLQHEAASRHEATFGNSAHHGSHCLPLRKS
jgi:hypothetical protein